MKTQLIALFLLTATAGGIAFYPKTGNSISPTIEPIPAVRADSPRIEVVFALDTTGSMANLIEAAKEKIWSIATTMASAQQAPEIRIGLVAYRDRGDAYVTQVTDLSADLDSMYATLMDYQAGGGGDTPESVNAALDAAVQQMSWSGQDDTYRAIFLVGDAPPHMDYPNERRYPEILAEANARGIVVNTIRCGESTETERTWQQIAAATQGEYFSVGQSGNAIAIATPYDEPMARLSAELDETRLYFGDDVAKAETAAKVAATEKLHEFASLASRARRAAFNTLEAGRDNLFGENDLLTAIEAGTSLEEIEEAELPATVRAMAPAAREAYVVEQAEKRKELSERITQLARQRDAYLAAEAAAIEDADDSLDYQVFEAVRSQAATKGLSYSEDAPKL